MSDLGLFRQGNAAFGNGDYQVALEKYNEAILLEGDNVEYLVKRAETYIKLGHYKDACSDADKAIQLEPENLVAHLRKGESLYNLGEYSNAKTVLESGQSIDENNKDIQSWLSKCKEMIAKDDVKQPENDAKSTSDNASKDEKPSTEKQSIETPAQPVVRKDWYQTDTFVTITLMVKQCKAQHVHISYQERHIGGKVDIPTGGTYELDLNLSHPIDITQCKTRILQSKIELKLKKKDAIHWTLLEQDKSQENIKAIPVDTKSKEPESTNTAHQYPSSKHVGKDWDRLAAEISKDDNEKEEGEAALNALFEKIYGEGNDQIKRAMNKSFVESGGTVLSTNWDEVGKNRVEKKPPDGMEWKKWEK